MHAVRMYVVAKLAGICMPGLWFWALQLYAGLEQGIMVCAGTEAWALAHTLGVWRNARSAAARTRALGSVRRQSLRLVLQWQSASTGCLATLAP